VSQGLDTPLAELLLARGLVGRPILSEALERVRRQRGQDEQVTLALFLLERQVLPAEALEQALREAARTTSRKDVASAGSQLQELGPYRLLRKLAEGGMGAVYEAEHGQTGVRYALKTIKAGVGQLLDEDALERLRREARLAAALDHRRIVRVHAAEFDGPVPYLVQDLLTGGTLSERVRASGVLSPEAGAELVAQLAEGLAVAHAAGILHRDLKPDNVLFSERGEPVLVDFGLSRRVSGNSIQLTQTGEILGTPAYMAPEQALDVGTAREAADVYALGAILYFLLEGVAPFQGQTVLETLNAALTKPAPEAASAPPALRALIGRVLDKEPSLRPTASELAELLRESVREPSPSGALGPLLVAALLAVALLVGALAWASGRGRVPASSPALTPSPTETEAPPAAPDLLAERLALEVRGGGRGDLAQALAALELLRRAPKHPVAERASELVLDLRGRPLVRVPVLPDGKMREGGFLPGGRSLYGLSEESVGRLDLETSLPVWRARRGPVGLELSRGVVGGGRLWLSLGMRRSWVYSLPWDQLESGALEEPTLRPAAEWRGVLQASTVQGRLATLALDPEEGYLAHGQGNRVSLHGLDPPRPLDMLELPLDLDSKGGASPAKVFADLSFMKFVGARRLLVSLNKRLPNPLVKGGTYPSGGTVLLLEVAPDEGLRLSGGFAVSQAATAVSVQGQEVYVGDNVGSLRSLKFDSLPEDPAYRRSPTKSNELGVVFASPLDYKASRVSGIAVRPGGTILVSYRTGEMGTTAELGRWASKGGAWSYRRLGETPLPRRLILSPNGDLLLLEYHRDARVEGYLGEIWLVGRS
jgi:protein kinase-like protein